MNSSGDSQSSSFASASASAAASTNMNSTYVSCIEIDGVPILPPLMTESRRAEMRRYRELAIRIEATRQLKFKKRQRIHVGHVDNSDNVESEPVSVKEKLPATVPTPLVASAPVSKSIALSETSSETDSSTIKAQQPLPAPPPLNTTVTFNVETSPITSPPSSLSSTFRKIPGAHTNRFGFGTGSRTSTLGGGISVVPGSPSSITIGSNSSAHLQFKNNVQLQSQIRREITPEKSAEEGAQDANQNPNQNTYDSHFIIKKSQESATIQQHQEADLDEEEMEDEGNPVSSSSNTDISKSNQSSSSSTSETQIHLTGLNNSSCEVDGNISSTQSATFTKDHDDDHEHNFLTSSSSSSKSPEDANILAKPDEFSFTGRILDEDPFQDQDNIQDDDRSESMSMVSLDTEEEQIRQEIFWGQRLKNVDGREAQSQFKAVTKPNPPSQIYSHSPFVTTRIRPREEKLKEVPLPTEIVQEESEESDNSLENYFPQPSRALANLDSMSTSTSTMSGSGRSSTETFIIERHASTSEPEPDSDEFNSINYASQNINDGDGACASKSVDMEIESQGEEKVPEAKTESESESYELKNPPKSRTRRKYYFSPIEDRDHSDANKTGNGHVTGNESLCDTTMFNNSVEQGAPSTVKSKKSYFNSPSPVPIPSSAPVSVPFKGYEAVEETVESKLTEVSFVTSIGSSTASPSSSRGTIKELTLSYTQNQTNLTFESPTKLVSNSTSASTSNPSTPRSIQKSGIPQLQSLAQSPMQHQPQSQSQDLSLASPKEFNTNTNNNTGSKRFYFSSPDAEDASRDNNRVRSSTTTGTRTRASISPDNSILKNSNNFNYTADADHSTNTSSFNTGYNSYVNHSIVSPITTKKIPQVISTKCSRSKIPLSPSKLNTMNVPSSVPSSYNSPSSYPYAVDGNGNLSKISQRIIPPANPNQSPTPRMLRTPPRTSSENVHQSQEMRATTPVTPVMRSPPIKKSFSMPYDYEVNYNHDQDEEPVPMRTPESELVHVIKQPQPQPLHSNFNQREGQVQSQNPMQPLGRVNLATLQTTMQNMSPSFFKVPPDARSPLLKGVVLMDPIWRPKRELRIPPQALDPGMKPKFARVTAAARGYLIRRLLRTEKIQMIIQTIRDTVELVLKLYEEVPQLRIRGGLGMNVRHEDAELCRRLFQQLTGACSSFHDVFFKLTAAQRMAIIAQDREKIRAKELKNYFSRSRSYRGGSGSSSSSHTVSSSSHANNARSRQSQQHSRSVSSNSTSNSKRKISTATVKCLERRMSALHS